MTPSGLEVRVLLLELLDRLAAGLKEEARLLPGCVPGQQQLVVGGSRHEDDLRSR